MAPEDTRTEGSECQRFRIQHTAPIVTPVFSTAAVHGHHQPFPGYFLTRARSRGMHERLRPQWILPPPIPGFPGASNL